LYGHYFTSLAVESDGADGVVSTAGAADFFAVAEDTPKAEKSSGASKLSPCFTVIPSVGNTRSSSPLYWNLLTGSPYACIIWVTVNLTLAHVSVAPPFIVAGSP